MAREGGEEEKGGEGGEVGAARHPVKLLSSIGMKLKR